jgi:hypothetical protein
LHGENEVFQSNTNDFPKDMLTLLRWNLKAYGGIILQLEANKFFYFFTGAIDHALPIFWRAFTGAGAIAPVLILSFYLLNAPK